MIMKNQNLISKPRLGMGVTINHYSDRTPATIISITHNGKRIVLQEDESIRIDNNGMSESQHYSYELDPNGALHFATLRKDGSFRLTGSKTFISLGIRQKYHDYSF